MGDICEQIGRYASLETGILSPQLRRENRIRTVHSSLAIENNTLPLDQVTAILDDKRVLGLPREIQEVRNAFQAYEHLDQWNPGSQKDLLAAHRLMMAGLVDNPGSFRSGGAGIFRGRNLVHMAPPTDRVHILMNDLLAWLKKTDEHPLVAGSIFHYELEFIHPFSDGNGRMGRLWQTLILFQWKALFAYLPVESVIHDRQEEYYHSLVRSDTLSDATPFIEFMLESLRFALEETMLTDQVSDQVTDQVMKLLLILSENKYKTVDLMKKLGLSHRPTFRKNYLEPALASEWIERTYPDSPRSPKQQYRITGKGRRLLR